MLSLLVITAVVGQYRQAACAVQYSAPYQAAYYPKVQAQYYAPQVQFQANPNYYAAEVASYVRREAADAAAQAALLDQLKSLTAAVAQLQQAPQQPQVIYQQVPAPQPPVQALPSPQAPSKDDGPPLPSPQVPPDYVPPLPYPDKSQGAVPPPPSLPGKITPPGWSNPYGTGTRGLPSPGTPSPGASLGGPGDDVAFFLKNNSCVQCHQGPGAKGGVRFFESDGSLAEIDYRLIRRTIAAVREGRMPPPGKPRVNPDHFNRFLTAVGRQINQELGLAQAP